jgi:hypothetical protein
MRRIESLDLWVGGRGDVRDVAWVIRAGVRALVDLALDEPPLITSREVVSCRFPLMDGSGNRRGELRAAVETVAALVRARVPTLVVCSAGMSRSPAVCAGAIALVTERPAAECLRSVTAGAPADVAPGLWADLCGVLVRNNKWGGNP